MTNKATREIEQRHQRDELAERADAVAPDREGDRAEHAERRGADDQPHGSEQHGGEGVDEARHQPAFLAADQRQADAEQHGEEQNLQHVVAREGVDGGRRNDVDEERPDASALQVARVGGVGVEARRVELGGVDVHARAGREHEADQQPEAERQRRHRLEIDERLHADPADLLEIAGAGDAMHDHAEHDRRDDHGDQFQEGVAEDFELHREVRRDDAEHDAEDQRGDNLVEQRAERGALLPRGGGKYRFGHRIALQPLLRDRVAISAPRRAGATKAAACFPAPAFDGGGVRPGASRSDNATHLIRCPGSRQQVL